MPQSDGRYGLQPRHHQSSQQHEIDRKVVILGQQDVGKSSLVLRYVHATFQENNASTIGASFLAKKVLVDETAVRLQIWDTAGQERFRSMAPMYYRGSHCAILCYDVTSMDSFEKMHSWLSELRKNMPADILINIVGTKLDLVKNDPAKRQVPFKTSVQFAAAQFGLQEAAALDLCHEISSKEDYDDGIHELFLGIAKRLLIDSEATDLARLRRAQAQRDDPNTRVHIADKSAQQSRCC